MVTMVRWHQSSEQKRDFKIQINILSSSSVKTLVTHFHYPTFIAISGLRCSPRSGFFNYKRFFKSIMSQVSEEAKNLQYQRLSFLNAYFNILVRTLTDNAQIHRGITTFTEEVSLATDDISSATYVSGIMLGMFSAMAFIMPTFTSLLLTTAEKTVGNKQLQFLMGMSRFIYWLANFIWDIVLYFFSVVLVMLFMLIFPDVFKQNMWIYFLCCMLFGVGMILASYVLSFVLKHAHVAVLLIFIFTPFFAVAALVLYSFREKSWYDTTDLILSAVPPYFISASLTIMAIQVKHVLKYHVSQVTQNIMSSLVFSVSRS